MLDLVTGEWTSLGPMVLLDRVKRLLCLNDGTLVAVGQPSVVNTGGYQVLFWSGHDWQPLGEWQNSLPVESGYPSEVVLLRNGDLLVSAYQRVFGGTYGFKITRLHEGIWSVFADGHYMWSGLPRSDNGLYVAYRGGLYSVDQDENWAILENTWAGYTTIDRDDSLYGFVSTFSILGYESRYLRRYSAGVETDITLEQNLNLSQYPFPTRLITRGDGTVGILWRDALTTSPSPLYATYTLRSIPGGDPFPDIPMGRSSPNIFVIPLEGERAGIVASEPLIELYHTYNNGSPYSYYYRRRARLHVGTLEGNVFSEYQSGSPGLYGIISALGRLPNDGLLAMGNFAIDNNDSPYITQTQAQAWDGHLWTIPELEYNTATTGTALASTPAGDLFMKGSGSYTADGTLVHVCFVVRRSASDQSFIHSTPAEPRDRISHIAATPSGDAAWSLTPVTVDGYLEAPVMFWHPGTDRIQIGTFDDHVLSLLGLADGRIVVGGYFGSVDDVLVNRVAVWDGDTWIDLGVGLAEAAGVGEGGYLGGVNGLTQLHDGSIVASLVSETPAGGETTSLYRLAGGTWTGIGDFDSGSLYTNIFALQVLSNGDLIAAGGFSSVDGIAASNIARWDGHAWSPFEAGIDGVVYALAEMSNGDLIAGGDFMTAGSIVSPFLARFATPCRCVADVDDGTGTGTRDDAVTVDDLLYYLEVFATGDIAADIDEGSGTGTHDDAVTVDDLLYYFERFQAGC